MKKYILILLLLISLIFSGCTKFLDINRDPDTVEKVPIENLLPGAEAAPLYAMRGNWQVICGYWSQHWTQSTNAPQFQDYDRFQVGNTTFSRGYGHIFASSLKELEYIKSEAEKKRNWAFYLIASTLQAYNYQILVDLFDKVPFDEALQGDMGIEYPEFDEGDYIYDQLIVMIDEALDKDFSSETVEWPDATSDIILGGDESSWKKFAKTLKLKIYLRQRFARNNVTQAGVSKLLSDGEFLEISVGHNLFQNAPEYRNTIYAINFEHAGNISVSNTLVSYMMEDDRDAVRFDELSIRPINAADYPNHRGLVQGDFYNIDFASDIEDLSAPRLAFDDYQYFFTLPEIYFMISEAYLIIGDDANARTNYESGIQAHFTMLGIASDATDVITGYASWDSYSDKLQAIIEQKWIAAVNIMALESFIEQNRTGYPDFYTVPVNNVTSGRFPQRFLIPQGEINNNSNTPQELIDAKVYDEVWWDKRD